MSQYKTPDIYYQENSPLLMATVEVETAIPAFIGFTEKIENDQGMSLLFMPTQIANMEEYESYFGKAQKEYFTVDYNDVTQAYYLNEKNQTQNSIDAPLTFYLYQAVEQFFDNGGTNCYIVSIGGHNISKNSITSNKFVEAIDLLQEIEEITLLSLPESVLLSTVPHYAVQNYALQHCQYMKNRVALVDVFQIDGFDNGNVAKDSSYMRENISQGLDYGAAYYPYLRSTTIRNYDDSRVNVNYVLSQRKLHKTYDGKFVSLSGEKLDEYGFLLSDTTQLVREVHTVYIDLTEKIRVDCLGYAIDVNGQQKLETEAYGIFTDREGEDYINIDGFVTSGENSNITDTINGRIKKDIAFQTLYLYQTLDYLSNLKGRLASPSVYSEVKRLLSNNMLILPPSSTVAGVIAKVDASRGVWKAPANIILEKVVAPIVNIDSGEQRHLNIDEKAGKSINAIRRFVGKGTRIWGVRTLRGNDNEWRYINVRRLFNLVEQSVKKATQFAVFETNTPFTWLKIKITIENYLEGLWQQGALFGLTPDSAFFVNVGLGQTMTQDDINNGVMHIEIGLAAVRPAEFIILTFSHNSLQG